MHHGFDYFSRKHEQGAKTSLAWSKRNITQELSKLEGGRACDFVREDDHIEDVVGRIVFQKI
jgi:hypothetical protein